MTIEYERYTIPDVANILKIPESTVRAAVNRANLLRDSDGRYLIPRAENHPQRVLFIRLMANGPKNLAEQLRRDLGCRPPRR